MTKSLELPGFEDGKDNLDNYLLQFEKYATFAGLQRDKRKARLSPLLTGKALNGYCGLSNEGAQDYNTLQNGFLLDTILLSKNIRKGFGTLKQRDKNHHVGCLTKTVNILINGWSCLRWARRLKT